MNSETLAAAAFIREIGRGRDNARALPYQDAAMLWRAVLGGGISDLELGAVLIAMRIKGESADELAAYLDVSDSCSMDMDMPPDGAIPVIIPSYNGARSLPNLTGLLALLLAREGIPVVVHGTAGGLDVHPAPNVVPRVTTAAIFQAMGVPAVRTRTELGDTLSRREPAFVPIETLNPPLARILSLRRILGVRNSAHTIAKLLQPFPGPALRLANYTHPEYGRLLGEFLGARLTHARGDVLLARGTEGEAVANARRPAPITWYAQGESSEVAASHVALGHLAPNLPESRDAASTARWIQAVAAGERPVPDPIAMQMDAIRFVLAQMQQRKPSAEVRVGP